MKIKINTMIVLTSLLLGVLMPASVFAETGTQIKRDTETEVVTPPNTAQPSDSEDEDPCLKMNYDKANQSCVDGVVTSVIKCDTNNSGNVEDSCVWSLLTQIINIMTAGIGLLAVGGVIYGSILYTTAGGSPDQTKQAIKIIQNVIIGLVAYAFMYAFLNYVIPGGLFK